MRDDAHSAHAPRCSGEQAAVAAGWTKVQHFPDALAWLPAVLHTYYGNPFMSTLHKSQHMHECRHTHCCVTCDAACVLMPWHRHAALDACAAASCPAAAVLVHMQTW